MRSLQEAVGRELLWKPRSLLSRTHDLVDAETREGEPYATLVWRPGLLMRGPAQAESGDGHWGFQCRGFLRESVRVVAAGRSEPIATLQRYWRRGVLRHADGRRFAWRRESWWSRVWVFEDETGAAVVRFRTMFAFPRSAARVEIELAAAAAADRALLACLGWYLLLLARRRAAARAGG